MRRWNNRAALLGILGVLLGPVGPANAAYHLLKKVTLGESGGWDLLSLDPVGRRLYVARSDRVMVVDADRYKLVAEIPNTPGVHGVAIARHAGRGFTSNGGDTSATIFDLKTLQRIGRVTTGVRPDAIVYDAATDLVFSMNVGSKDVTAIDAAKGTVIGTVPLDGRPEFAVTDGKGKLFVNLEDSSAVQVLDTHTLTPVARWSLSPGTEPTGLALDRERHRLFAACADSLMVVMDSNTGRVIASLPIGRGPDAAAYDSSKRLAFSSNGEGTVTVIHEDGPDNLRVRETVPTKTGARTMALDEKTHRLYLVSADFGPPPTPTPERPHPRGPVLPGTFVLLVYGE